MLDLARLKNVNITPMQQALALGNIFLDELNQILTYFLNTNVIIPECLSSAKKKNKKNNGFNITCMGVRP